MRHVRTLRLGLVAVVLLAGCAGPRRLGPAPLPAGPKDYLRPLPPGAAALRKIEDPACMPDFRRAFPSNPGDLVQALDLSLRYLRYPSARSHFPMQGITHTRAAASLVAFRDLLVSAQSADEFSRRLTALFDVYQSVGCDNAGTVLFTGYYTPIFEASLTPDSEYRWPLYKLPPDLVKDARGECLGRRLPDGGIVPYYTRAEIHGGALSGHELVYLRDRFEAYVCGVQGSAHLRLPDGRLFRVGYHGNNGWPYTSVGKLLVAAGLMPRERLSLSGLIKFFTTRPEIVDEYLPRNARYVFFQPTDVPPTGSLGVPVTAHRTIATDKSIYPRGCVAFVDTVIPNALGGGQVIDRPFRQFVLDQDSGGAIRAPGRADLYLGVGEAAGNIAGWMYREGRLYYLFLKD